MKIIFSFILFPIFLFAQEESSPLHTPEALHSSALRRGETSYLGMISYSPIDLLIPSKLGITLAYLPNAEKTWELEMMRGSISVPLFIADLGGMTDVRISLSQRTFLNDSFNIFYGISYFSFQLQLGDDIISRLTSGAIPNVDLVRIQSLGVHFGLGNRWTMNKNITLGVDWLSWYQPIAVTSNQNVFLDYATNQTDRDEIETAEKLISYLPRLVVLKLQLGWAF